MGDIDEAMEDWRRVVQEFGDFGKNSFPQTKNFVAWALVDQGRVLAGDLPDMNFDHLTEEDIFPEINQQKEASSDNSEDMFGNLSLGYSIGLRDGQTEVKGAPQENFAEALKLFDEALSRFQSGDVQGISSPLSQAMLLKGQIYKKQGDLARALEAFTVLTQRFLHDADSEAQNNVAGAFVNQGSVLAAQGNFQQALQAFDAAITQAKELQDDFASRSTPLIANLGKAYLFLKDGKNQAALAIFDVVIQDQKEDIDELSFVSAFAWQGKAWALERMGKFPETMACYDDAFARFGAQKAIKVQKANTIMDFMGKWAIVQAKAGALVRHGDKAAALKAKEDFSDYAKKIYDAEAKLAGGSSMFPAMAMVTYLSALPGAVDDKILSAQQALEAVDREIRHWQLRDVPAWLPMPLQTKAQIQDKDTDKTAVLETLDEIIKTFQDSADVNAQNVFGWALARKAVILRDQGDKAAAILLCEEILRRFEHAPPANMTGMVDNVKRILKEMR
jgi:tetratricopeptide (TPR) repeat protein